MKHMALNGQTIRLTYEASVPIYLLILLILITIDPRRLNNHTQLIIMHGLVAGAC